MNTKDFLDNFASIQKREVVEDDSSVSHSDEESEEDQVISTRASKRRLNSHSMLGSSSLKDFSSLQFLSNNATGSAARHTKDVPSHSTASSLRAHLAAKLEKSGNVKRHRAADAKQFRKELLFQRHALRRIEGGDHPSGGEEPSAKSDEHPESSSGVWFGDLIASDSGISLDTLLGAPVNGDGAASQQVEEAVDHQQDTVVAMLSDKVPSQVVASKPDEVPPSVEPSKAPQGSSAKKRKSLFERAKEMAEQK